MQIENLEITTYYHNPLVSSETKYPQIYYRAQTNPDPAPHRGPLSSGPSRSTRKNNLPNKQIGAREI